MKNLFIFFIIFQLFTFNLIIFALPAYSIGLDDEIEDQEDIEDSLQEAREKSDNGNFSAAEQGSSQTPQDRSSSQGKQEGTLSVKVESGGILISIELDRYVVKIKKSNNLNGDYAYGLEDKKTGSGSFLGSPATFYYKKFGYYEVECTGYNKYSKEVFRIKYINIKHACSITDVTIYASGSQPYIYCP